MSPRRFGEGPCTCAHLLFFSVVGTNSPRRTNGNYARLERSPPQGVVPRSARLNGGVFSREKKERSRSPLSRSRARDYLDHDAGVRKVRANLFSATFFLSSPSAPARSRRLLGAISAALILNNSPIARARPSIHPREPFTRAPFRRGCCRSCYVGTRRGCVPDFRLRTF